jgi:hypothetical protein
MVYCGLKNPALPSSGMLVIVPQLATLEILQCLVFVDRSPSSGCARVAKVDIMDLDIVIMCLSLQGKAEVVIVVHISPTELARKTKQSFNRISITINHFIVFYLVELP